MGEEIQQYLSEADRLKQISQWRYGGAFATLRRAEEAYQKAIEARDRILQNTLKEKRLAVCSELHFVTSPNAPDEWKTKSAEQLGIYPRDQMRLQYDSGLTSSTDHFTLVTSSWLVAHILLLCPEHFSQKYLGIYGTKEVPRVSSEVIQKGRKFVLTLNGKDITKLVNRGGSSRLKIELDGNTDPDLAIYKYFGIPDLPERPDINSTH